MKKNVSNKMIIKPGVKLFLCAFPQMVLIFLLCYLPLEGWKYAFYDYAPGRLFENCNFIGLRNFTSMFTNVVMRREFARVMKNQGIYILIGWATCWLPMACAILLNEFRSSKYRRVVQTCITLPNFVSWIVVFSLATNVFAINNGILNILLKDLGIIEKGINVLATDKHVYLFMWALGNWKGLGYSAIVYMAAISGLDQELFEAAAIDGANRFQKIWYITIPGLMPTFLTLFLMGIGSILSSDFDKHFVFMNAFNADKIETLDLYVYNLGIGRADISYSTAIGMAKSVIGIILLLISNWLSGLVREEKIF